MGEVPAMAKHSPGKLEVLIPDIKEEMPPSPKVKKGLANVPDARETKTSAGAYRRGSRIGLWVGNYPSTSRQMSLSDSKTKGKPISLKTC